MQQKELSLWLRGILVPVAVMFTFLIFYVLPRLGTVIAEINPEISRLFWPCLIFCWATSVPVYWSLWLCRSIFIRIGKNESFSRGNADALRTISRLAVIDSAAYSAVFIIFSVMGILTINAAVIILGIALIGIVLAVITAALSHLTRKAADLKAESDLTI